MFMHNIKGSRVEVFDGGGVRHRRAVPHPHPQDEPALIRRDAVADHRLLWSSEGKSRCQCFYTRQTHSRSS